MMKYSIEDSIVALATPKGESAIAVIRTSGKDSLSIISKLFKGKTKLDLVKTHTLCHGLLIDPETRERIDEVVIAIYREPASYTGETSIEIFCHGSSPIINKIITLLVKRGFRQAGPGEFTLRAFLNDKMDLTRAEAVNELIRAKSDKARALAFSRLSGSIENRINLIKEDLKTLLATLEIQIDYPEDDRGAIDYKTKINKIIKNIRELASTYKTGKIIQEGITVVIAGSTNSGKSTLFNLLLREDRSIVSDIHGTTRDYIEGCITIEGIPIRLFDTAGLRNTKHPIEIEGMRRTDKIMEDAQVLLYIVDATKGIKEKDKKKLKYFTDITIIIKIWNKIDITDRNPPPGFIPFCARDGLGLKELNDEIYKNVLGQSFSDVDTPVIDSLRQKELLNNCLLSLEDYQKGLKDEVPLDVLSTCIQDALDELGKITGDVTTTEVLETMFSNFCVGK